MAEESNTEGVGGEEDTWEVCVHAWPWSSVGIEVDPEGRGLGDDEAIFDLEFEGEGSAAESA